MEIMAPPDWFRADLWGEWCGHRDDLNKYVYRYKKPFTPRAQKMLIKEMEEVFRSGVTAAAIEQRVRTAIINGWLKPFFDNIQTEEKIRQRETNPYIETDYGPRSTKEVASAAILQIKKATE